MTFFLRQLIFVSALVLSVMNSSCSRSGGGSTVQQDPDSEVMNGEVPKYKRLPTGAIVEFDQPVGASVEAWEVVVQGNTIFLNYSRFPYGTATYKGQPTYVCTANLRDVNKKYVAISEAPVRAKKAIFTTIVETERFLPAKYDCLPYAEVQAKYPTLEKVFESIR